MYEVTTTTTMFGEEEIVYENIKYTDENGHVYMIPVDQNNPDYQKYLESLA